MKTKFQKQNFREYVDRQCADRQCDDRQGSTLVIVIAMLGLLAFLGMVFYTFAAQERASAEYFSEAAKAAVDDPPNVWDHMLRHVISGPTNRPSDRGSILRSSDRHYSIVSSLVGNDIIPHNGDSIRVIYNTTTGVPMIDQNYDGTADGVDWLDFVDSPAVRGRVENRAVARPSPDVDYTYPDLNNMFLAYKGWAVRDNGPSVPIATRYERVPVIIPSFFRPQYMKTGNTNGQGGQNVLTDYDWASAFDGTDRTTAKFAARSFRPSPQHLAGFLSNGTAVPRYLTDAEATSLGVTSGGFPFIPANETNSGNGTALRGELGIWTGAHPSVYELDADNDGDGTNEGIWLDLHFPLQETTDSGGAVVKYVVLHSVTIYDMDSLIDVNVHGNLAGLGRNADYKALATAPSGPGNILESLPLSRSNLGLGPNEINPTWAISTSNRAPGGSATENQLTRNYGATPDNDLEQANMEWLWILAGRGKFNGADLDDILPGRWGEAERLYTAVSGTSLVSNLPRPGRPGNADATLTGGIRFGGNLAAGQGRDGFDDNQDSSEGEALASNGRVRPFGTPLDYAGTGTTNLGVTSGYNQATQRFTVSGNPLLPIMHHDTASTGPERWLMFSGYSLTRGFLSTVDRYMFGQNGTFDNGAGDDLLFNPFLDPLFEDPLESIFDSELADRAYDLVFGPQDALALQLHSNLLGASVDDISDRVQQLAPVAFDPANNELRERFTTLSNSLRRFAYKHQLGPDMTYGTADDGPRAWENTADSDGADNNNDGFPDGDGYLEFPPVFGPSGSKILPYRPEDPFRPQTRRLLLTEVGENRQSLGQLPLSINHLLDVERNTQTPQEGTREFLQYMQRAGMRFRPLTEHPDATEAGVVTTPTIPTWSAATPVQFPPQTADEREFWARRDRQKLARDIYVLLYTTGGAELLNRSVPSDPRIKDYTGINDPAAIEGSPTSLYTHDQLRRMAQFAVNMVDAMDSDNVITKFEYDKNLGDGWNLDDDPYVAEYPPLATATGNGLYPEDSDERGVVYGVEAQQLAFSEVQAIRSPAISGMDHPATPYDDTTIDRDFLFVELQNMLPLRQVLGTTSSNTAATAVWRIARFDRDGPSGDLVENPATPDRAIAFLQNLNNEIEGGGRFSISVASDPGLASSAFHVDLGDVTTGNFDNTFELIAPNAIGTPLPNSNNQAGSTDPGYDSALTDLDVIHTDHAIGRFDAVGGNFMEAILNYNGTDGFHLPTDSLNGEFDQMGGLFGFDMTLQRRLNPNMPLLSETDNPWVEVDRIRVLVRPFDLIATDSPAEIYTPAIPGPPAQPASGKIVNVFSEERIEPLNDGSRRQFGVADASALTPYRLNSIKGDLLPADDDMLGINTQNATNPFLLWQQHFDRDFASPAELMQVPVYGPNLLTQRLRRSRYPAFQQAFPDPATANGADPLLIASAEAMFLGSDFPDQTPTALSEEDARDNRWYRLMQFVEVPSRVHRMLGNYLSIDRVPGKLNMNMLRHMEVFAGMVDNPLFANTDINPVNMPYLDDSTPGFSGTEFYSNPSGPPGGNVPPPGGGPGILPPGWTSNQTQTALPVQDRWLEYLTERDGITTTYDSVNNRASAFWIPGTPNAQPFRSLGYVHNSRVDNGQSQTLLRILSSDRVDLTGGAGSPFELATNRHWLEVGGRVHHRDPGLLSAGMQRHQILSKLMNNTTTVSNTFIVYSTAAYFEAIEDPVSGLVRVGGRLDLDGDSDPENDQQRAVFILDRTEAFKAFDAGTGDFDWRRLVKHRTTIE